MIRFGRAIPGMAAVALLVAFCGMRAGRAAQGQASPSPELVLQGGHSGAINAIAFSPDGGTLATGSADGTVRVWEAETGALIRTLGGYEDEVHTVFYSRDGRTLVSQSSVTPACSTGDGCVNVIRFHDAGSFALTRKREVGGFKGCTAIVSPDLESVVRADDLGLEILDGRTMKRRAGLEAAEPAVFAPDGRSVVFQDGVGFNVRTGRRGQAIPSIPVPLAFSPDGRRLLGADTREGRARLLMAETQRGALLWEVASVSGATAFSPDGAFVAVVEGRTVKMLDAATGRLRRALRGQEEDFVAVAVSPDGQTIATGDAAGNLRLWSAEAATARWAAFANEAIIRGIALTPDRRTIVIARGDHRISLWDLSTGALTHQRVSFAGVWDGIELSQDGHTAAIRNRAGEITLWDLQASGHLRTLRPEADLFRLSPDMLTIAIVRGEEVHVVDARTGRERFALRAGGAAPRAIDVSPDNRLLAVAGERDVRLWNLQTGALQQMIPVETAIDAIRFSRNSRQFALGAQRRIEVREIASGRRLGAAASAGFDAAGREAAFSPDGQTLAINQCYEVEFARGGKTAGTVGAAAYNEIRDFAFSPDGRSLFAASHTQIEFRNITTGKRDGLPLRLEATIVNARFLPDGNHLVVAAGTDVSLWNLRERRRLATLALFAFRGEGEWVVSTPEHLYAGSDRIETRIRWRVGGRTLPTDDELRARFHRPDVVQTIVLPSIRD